MARIAAVAPALPAFRYTQAEITEVIAPLLTSDRSKQAVLRRLHAGSKVDTRHLVQPIEQYVERRSFTDSNAIFVEKAAELTGQALMDALARAGLKPTDIDYIMFTTVTGISAMSIEGLLVSRLGMRPDVKRVPMYGLGCVAGASGIARVNDYLAGHPHDVAVLISVELCSLTFQPDDDSTANMVATGLFGDGAAAVVMVGDERAKRMPVTGPDVVATRSQLYPDTEDVIGFLATTTGFRILLTPRVAEIIEANFDTDVLSFLDSNDLDPSGVDSWVAHPGGPRVLEAFETSLGLGDGALDRSWKSLAAVGNLSSASVLHILADQLEVPQGAGDTTLLFALGPGVSAEFVLMRWPS
ncbi:MAG: type polyketide synthase [Microbacteriaceae bacterium]|nr:type polyketide synthase [Microbacteriaceae bacterium]